MRYNPNVSVVENAKSHLALETEYIRIFGERRFSEYDSFRGSVTTKKSTGV